MTHADAIEDGSWVCLTQPTPEEIRQVAGTLDIEPADLQAALDPEESARVSLEDGYTVIIVDIPVPVPDKGEGVYTTIPLGILLTQTTVTTVCAVDTPVLADFTAMRVRDFSTKKKMRFVYQILYRAATMYQLELRLVDRRRQEIEKNLAGSSTQDSDLIELHALESTLVYFATSLRANSTVLDRLTRYKRLEQYPDDMELLGRRDRRDPPGHRDDRYLPRRHQGHARAVQRRAGQPPEQHYEMADFGHADHGGADRDLGAIRHERQPGQHAVCGQFVRVRHRVRADFGDLLCRGVGAAQKAYAVISNRARWGAALPFSVFPVFSVTRADKYRLYG